MSISFVGILKQDVLAIKTRQELANIAKVTRKNKIKRMKNKVIILLCICSFFVAFSSCYHHKGDIEYPSSVCDTTNVTLSGQLTDIMEANCFRCHSSANAATSGGSYNLQDYNTIHGAALSGALLSSILQDNKLAPPMPQDGGKLSDCEINKFRAWIDEGAQNN